MSTSSNITIGLLVGEGTGPELAGVFRRAVAALAARAGVTVEIDTCPGTFQTFVGAQRASTTRAAEQAMRGDADRYVAFLRDLHRRGVAVVFRTAINAHSLYRTRELLGGIKVEVLPLANGELLLVRDATQGFYAGDNEPGDDDDEVRRVCTFRRSSTRRVLQFAIREAAARYGDVSAVTNAIVAYKFHLLGPAFARWVSDVAAETGVPFQIWQPDTANRNLLAGLLTGRTLIVGANEWADVMHPHLIAMTGLGRQEERCSRTVFLDESVSGMEEVQTVHGSADALAGLGIVNPVGTLRAAALALDRSGASRDSSAVMDRAIAHVEAAGWRTPDAGGRARTDDVVDAVLDRLGMAAIGAAAP